MKGSRRPGREFSFNKAPQITKTNITPLAACLVLSAQIIAAAAESQSEAKTAEGTPNVIGALPSDMPLVEQRFREGLDVIAKSPAMVSVKPSGQDIWKALLLLHQNKNIEEAEKSIT